ncbi:MAG: hypothetical protein N2C14_11030, partial [Planctomycetales bacterium]
MSACSFPALFLALFFARTGLGEPNKGGGELTVRPESMTLTHRRNPHSILVSTTDEHGRLIDLTGQATFKIADEKIARVDLQGWVRPIASGKTEVQVSAAGKTVTIPIISTLPDVVRPFSFRHEVSPVLSKGGCNAGACHGYSLGKNGFKLSLRGADLAADYQWTAKEFLGRRINRHHPPAS